LQYIGDILGSKNSARNDSSIQEQIDADNAAYLAENPDYRSSDDFARDSKRGNGPGAVSNFMRGDYSDSVRNNVKGAYNSVGQSAQGAYDSVANYFSGKAADKNVELAASDIEGSQAPQNGHFY